MKTHPCGADLRVGPMVKIMVALDFLGPFPASQPKYHVCHASLIKINLLISIGGQVR